MASTKPRPKGRRALRLRHARYNQANPPLTVRLSPEDAEQVRAAGGLQEVVRAFLAGETVPERVAEAMASDRALAAAERVEADALTMIAKKDKQIASLLRSRKEDRAALIAANGRAAAAEAQCRALQAAAQVAQARQATASYQEGVAAGKGLGAREEADRRAAARGFADAAQARASAAGELAAVVRKEWGLVNYYCSQGCYWDTGC